MSLPLVLGLMALRPEPGLEWGPSRWWSGPESVCWRPCTARRAQPLPAGALVLVGSGDRQERGGEAVPRAPAL